MRRSLPWLLALPLMAAGSVAAHSLSYLVVSAPASEGGAEVAERASSGDAGYLVLFLGMVAALVVVAAVARLVVRGGGRRGGVFSPWLFFVLPPLAFGLQEFSERLLGAEAFPFQAALEPKFLLGLLLQLPFGLLALLLASLLLRVAERLVLAFGLSTAPHVPAIVSWSRRQAIDLPRIPALALGYPERGPPTP